MDPQQSYTLCTSTFLLTLVQSEFNLSELKQSIISLLTYLSKTLLMLKLNLKRFNYIIHMIVLFLNDFLLCKRPEKLRVYSMYRYHQKCTNSIPPYQYTIFMQFMIWVPIVNTRRLIKSIRSMIKMCRCNPRVNQ